jgi:hypothetical protein
MDRLWTVVASPQNQAKTEVAEIRAMSDRPLWSSSSTLPLAYHSPLFRYLLELFASNYLLIAHLPAPSRDTGRRILLKYAYDLSFKDYPVNSARRLLWAPVQFELKLGMNLPAGSHHFEVHVPEGLELTSAKYVAQWLEDPNTDPVTWSWQEAVDDELPRYRTVSHHHLRQVPSTAQFLGVVNFGVRRGAVVWVSLGAALLLTLAVWTGSLRPELFLTQGDMMVRSVLLLIPGLVSSGALLQHEHRFARHMMLVLRIVVPTIMLLSIAAIVLMFAAIERDSSGLLLQSSAMKLEEYWANLRWAPAMTLLLMLPALVPLSVQRWWALRAHRKQAGSRPTNSAGAV